MSGLLSQVNLFLSVCVVCRPSEKRLQSKRAEPETNYLFIVYLVNSFNFSGGW